MGMDFAFKVNRPVTLSPDERRCGSRPHGRFQSVAGRTASMPDFRERRHRVEDNIQNRKVREPSVYIRWEDLSLVRERTTRNVAEGERAASRATGSCLPVFLIPLPNRSSLDVL